ncbi:MAG: hypothetical protein MUF21_01450 [Gemmatimonadaceae bacterium]|nr:hypothetical protein [Gemmatimonadaceae bacterium]
MTTPTRHASADRARAPFALPIVQSLHHEPYVAITAAADDRPRGRAAAIFLPLMATLMLGAVATSWLRPPHAVALPAVLAGEWRTTEPAYRDRALRLGERMIGIVPGEGLPAQDFVIVEATATPRGDSTVVTLAYEQDGAAVPMRIAFVTADPSRLVLSSPRGAIWERAR